jgi:hypothetical protein
MSNQYTTDEIFTPREPSAEGQPTRFIDIHIYEQEAEGQPSIESHLEPEPAARDESHQEHTELRQPHRKRRNIIALCVGIACLALIGALIVVFLLPLLTPEATVTLVPSTQQVRTTATITVTTGAPTGTEIPGRALAAITMNQARTIPTTGKGHQDARAAHGLITFYNAATYPQTVTAGTVLTGADGVQIVTDADANIPEGTLATNGARTVPAHALQVGPGGNIRAEDIYGACCRVNVLAANTTFTGGQQARDYQTVTPQDITTVVTSLKTSLIQSVQAALQTQVHSDETLVTPLPCQQSVKPDHQPGEEATQVQITVSEMCTGTTYSTQAYQNRIMQIANQQAGDGYTPIGQVQSTIIQATTQGHNRMQLHVMIAQTYAYQVSQEQQQHLKTLIAGKSKAQATSILLHTPGLQSVSVSSATIPTDTKHIRVIVVYVG